MTDKEWLTIGYTNGIITHSACEDILFKDAYVQWFKMKMQFIKKQTLDRIEVTYNRYYARSDIVDKCISKISEADIILFLSRCCHSFCISYKEMGRIMQIANGVLVYMRDIEKGGCPLLDWNKIKRNIPTDKIESKKADRMAVPKKDIEKLMRDVMENKIYHEKQSACLCLCMNFYLGLRVGELSALSFDDFDLKRNVVKVYKTESKFYNRDDTGARVGSMTYEVVDSTKTIYSVREVPLLPEARYIYGLIKKHHELKHYDSKYLAYDGKQTVLVRSLDRTLRRLVALCEIRPFATHDIRRTFATMLHHSGVPTRAISDLMGHREIGTTERCYILSYNEHYAKYLAYMKQSLTYRI